MYTLQTHTPPHTLKHTYTHTHTNTHQHTHTHTNTHTHTQSSPPKKKIQNQKIRQNRTKLTYLENEMEKVLVLVLGLGTDVWLAGSLVQATFLLFLLDWDFVRVDAGSTTVPREIVTPRSSPSFSCARFLSVNYLGGRNPHFIVTVSRDWVVFSTLAPRNSPAAASGSSCPPTFHGVMLMRGGGGAGGRG